MRQRIFMYLFIFTLLLVLFQYVNSKNVFEDQMSRIEAMEAKVEVYKDSIISLKDDNYDMSLFDIQYNDDALTYFENEGYDTSKLIPIIKDELYSLNEAQGEEHPLVPYAGTGGNKMLINSIKILNHKWIVTNFSDSQMWGELFLTYELNDGKLNFKMKESFLYPVQN